ncbi:hypothetical protein EPO44_02785 [bacterium]|nr:MAG: hypothetical protein EPO44_02785 [bacterium]
MKRHILKVGVLIVALTALSTAYAQVNVDFGDPETGAFVMTPDEVTIVQGETVTFLVHGNHQVAIYRVDNNTTRGDIESDIVRDEDYVITDGAGALIVNTVNRDAGHPGNIHDHFTSPLAFLGANQADVDTGTVDRDPALSANVTFLRVGRYLVICAVKRHLDLKMFGFVTVLEASASQLRSEIF